MEIYFDNAATTKVPDKVAQAMLHMLTTNFGNPSSLHQKGFEAEKAIETSRQNLAQALKVNKKEIYFTSGGTEANNIAISGVAVANKRSGRHILVSSIEHPSVKETVRYLETLGYEVETIPTDSMGYIQIETLEQLIRQDTLMVSIMYVNNEIGTIQDMSTIGKLIKAINPKTLFHVDAIQAFGKYILTPTKDQIDLLTLSGHKIHGPKGIGAIYIKEGTKITPLFYGGRQENGIRSGTENVPGIIGLGVATEEAYDQLQDNRNHIEGIKKYMIARLRQDVPDITFNGDIEKGAYHLLNIGVLGVKSEVLLHALEELEIYVSTGSACSSKKKNHSITLSALNLTHEEKDNAIRLSFSKYNTQEEVDQFIEQLNRLLPILRRFKRK
ncbi:Cysteine desulfurase IscS [Petrocella atlantisensis]|uniref:Cysteine desulfurase IscS n=1 Tax=Petrocella atlantisensis TaxID=2173034 RepID=A0A3P7S403_9FIRM|nr:cysteine desulfurase family protein [Petrocella atlantisensis]VDN49352.1 Cysteine desulfurase IscS [Petrocella atlantisensis]